jgi:hypothetical protein
MYTGFTALVPAIITVFFLVSLPGKWLTLVLIPVALFLGYTSIRLATLQVRLDAQGIWEPDPFRLTYVTPWNDVTRVRRTSQPGAMKTRFIGIEIVHADGDTHELLALKMQGGAAYAEPTVDDWIGQIREYRKAAR